MRYFVLSCFRGLLYGSGDKNDYFLIPVSRTEVPDYYDVITKPMSWSVIDKKLSDHAYMDLQEFKVRSMDLTGYMLADVF